MTSDEMTIAVIEGMLDLIDEASLTNGVRLTPLKNCLLELSKAYYKGSEKEKEITEDASVHVYFPSLKAKTAVKIPVVDGVVTIDGRNMEDILMLAREGYVKEDEYKSKINSAIASLDKALNG